MRRFGTGIDVEKLFYFISSFYTRIGKFEQLQFNKQCSKKPLNPCPRESKYYTSGKSAEDSHSKPPILTTNSIHWFSKDLNIEIRVEC